MSWAWQATVYGITRVGHNLATFTSLSIGIGVGMWLSKIVLCSYSDIQSHPAICDPMYFSPLGSSVHRFLQARILEWVAIPFSQGFPVPGIEPAFPVLQADSLPLSHLGSQNKNKKIPCCLGYSLHAGGLSNIKSQFGDQSSFFL